MQAFLPNEYPLHMQILKYIEKTAKNPNVTLSVFSIEKANFTRYDIKNDDLG